MVGFFLLLLLEPFLIFAQDKVPACKLHYNEAKNQMLWEVDRLEDFYVQYRWVETKIRILTYENLWQARQDGLDPLSKEKRAEGNEEEDRLLLILEDLDRQSSEASTGLWAGLKKFRDQEKRFRACCPEKHFEDCMNEPLTTVFNAIEAGLPLFDHIFEREREYRKEVDLTAGSRRGLYPEDALEAPVKHEDYFPRYEMERRSRRFEDDREMIRFFQSIRKMLTMNFAGNECCYACGKTDWEAKTERMFLET